MDVLQELEKAGAVLLNQHFVYKSGEHGSGYINMDPLFPNVRLMNNIAAELRKPFIEDEMQVITGPPAGGMILAIFAALWWPTSVDNYRTEFVWADKKGDGFAFKRAGFAKRLKGKKVLVLEDVLTTGGSVA
jgi:orotate phosphoribosyltransferase